MHCLEERETVITKKNLICLNYLDSIPETSLLPSDIVALYVGITIAEN